MDILDILLKPPQPLMGLFFQSKQPFQTFVIMTIRNDIMTLALHKNRCPWQWQKGTSTKSAEMAGLAL